MFSSRCVYFIAFLTLTLTACGGGESSPPKQPAYVAPVEIVADSTVDLSGQAGTLLSAAKKINGVQSANSAAVSSSFANAIGTIRSASSSSNVEGNLTLGVTASDSDEMTKVSLFLPKVGRSFVLCSNNCIANFQSTITGFNPQLADEVAGPLRIELIVEDNLGNSAVVDALNVNWQPIQISAVNASRENGVISVSWSGNSQLGRYNVYAATEPGLTALNVLELDNGIQQLAINGTSAQFSDVDASRDYHLLVTGIDNGGESGRSIPYVIPRTIGDANLPPIANNDSYEVNEDESLLFNALENDVDPDGQLITLDSILLQPFNGTLVIDDAGNFIYQPNPNFVGRENVSYRIVDNEGAFAEATIVINVLPVNDNPVALNDAYGVDANGQISFEDTNLLSNDSDVDGDELLISTTPIEAPEKGTLTINVDGSFSYQASELLLSNDQFVYQISDGHGGTANATVTISPNGDPLPPNANSDDYQVNEDTTLVISTVDLGILANDNDPKGLAIELLDTLLVEPKHGQLNLALDGTFTYIPNSNFFGVDQFQYQIKNSDDITAQAYVTITVLSTDDIPLASPDNYQAEEDITLVVDASSGLLVNDVDFGDSGLSVNTTPVNPPLKGELILAEDGSFSYLPTSNFNGVDSFTYQVINGEGLTDNANVNIVVSAINDAPTVIDDSVTINEDARVIVDVLANDSDIEGDVISLISVDITNGTADIVNGKLDITPELDFFGQLNISYTVADSFNASSTGKLVVTVLPINDAPLAISDSYSLVEDSLLRVEVTGTNHLLVNDSDVDGDALMVNTTPVISVSNGSLTLNSDGSFSYVPNLNFNGSDNFTYQVSDGNGGTAQALVSLTVNGVNDIPVLTDDSYSVDENTSLTRTTADTDHLLSNDIDGDGDVLTVSTTPESNVSNGNLTLNSDGSFSYVPSLDFNGSDSFTYQVSDGNGGTAQASVSITVNALANSTPVAVADSYSFNEDFPWTRLVTDGDHLLSNDTDSDGDTLTVNSTPVSDVTNGSLTLNSDGSFSYTPSLNFNGTDNFSYEITDGNGGTAQASVTLIVNAVNDVPEPSADSYTIDEDNTLTILVGDENNLLSNDSDVEGDSLTVNTTAISDVINGILTLNSDGSFTYIPDVDFNGTDNFTYQVNDGNGGTAQANVSLIISAVNDAPRAVGQTFNVDETETDGFLIGTVVASDIESDTLTFSLTAGDTGLFNINSSTGAITVKGATPLDYEVNPQHIVTVTIDDDGTPIAGSTDITVTIDVNDVAGDETISEVAGFGRAAFGSLELTGIKTQGEFNDSVRDGSKVYFIGSIDNVDKDVYMVAYDTNGSIDSGFGTNGIKSFDFGANEYGKAIVAIGGEYFVTFERDDGQYREVCFIKVNNLGVIDVNFGGNGLRCTTEQKILSINDAVYIQLPATQGNPATEIDTVVAVGKVQGPADDDLLVIRVDIDGNFQTSTIYDAVADAPIVYSPHVMLDITGNGLDDEGIAVYNPHNDEIMVAGNVLTADGDYDIFAWIFNPKNADGNYVKFNNSTPQTYDVGGIGADDKVQAIDGENTGAGEHTAHIAGSTVLANGEQDAFIIELDSYAAYVPGFGTGGRAIYDVDGVPGSGRSEFTDYIYNYANDDMYLTGNLFDGNNYQPFATRVFLDGSVDAINYGVNGYQVVDYAGANAYAQAMSLDSTQGVWVPGYVEDGSDKNMIISAFDSSGALYNQNDIVNGKNTLTHSSTPSDDIAAEVLQIQSGVQAGKFLVAATADDSTNKHVILTRLTSAGLLDSSFDNDGHKQLQIGTSATVNGLFELASGQFIVYGNVTEGLDTNGYVARIDQNGLLDASFATNGIYTTSAISATNIEFNQVKVDSIGRLIAVGNLESGSISAFILRLTAAGALDTVFNTLDTPGYVIGAATDDYKTLLIDGSNNIYAAGNRDGAGKDMLLVKYLATGLLDTTLNGSGVLTIDFAGANESVEYLSFDSNSKLYLVGNDLDSYYRIKVVKTSSLGVLDTSFSGDGKVSLKMASIADLDGESSMTNAAIDSNDNIVVVGFNDVLLSGKRHLIGRIKPDGTLDTTFDLGGYKRVSTCGNTAQLESIILLNNSSFIVAGQCYIDSTFKNNIDISHYVLD